MAPSVDRKVSLLNLVRRFWMGIVLQPLVVGLLVLGLALGTDNTMVHEVVHLQQSSAPEHHGKEDIPPLPLSVQTRTRVLQAQVTRATVTGHKLTEAHFFGRRDLSELSAETNKNSDKG